MKATYQYDARLTFPWVVTLKVNGSWYKEDYAQTKWGARLVARKMARQYLRRQKRLESHKTFSEEL